MEQYIELPENPTPDDIKNALSTFTPLTDGERRIIIETIEHWLHRDGVATTSITSVVVENLRKKVDGIRIGGQRLVFACLGGKLSLIAFP